MVFSNNEKQKKQNKKIVWIQDIMHKSHKIIRGQKTQNLIAKMIMFSQKNAAVSEQ